MYLETLVTSAFPKLNPQTYGVINVQPEGKDWYVIAEQASMNPVFESGDREEAIARAHALAQAADLVFWADWLDNEKRCETYYQGALLTQSNDGLPLIPVSIIQNALVFNKLPDLPPEDLTDNEYYVAHRWDNFLQAMGVYDNNSVLVCVEIPDEHPAKEELDYVWVMLSKIRGVDGDEKSTVRIEQLDPYKQSFGKQSLYDVFSQYKTQHIHSWVLDGPDDFQDESGFKFKYIKRECPLYLDNHDPATQRERVFIHEGGAVMEEIAATRPWMVQKDANGKALPLRISPISDFLDQATEECADKHAQFLTSIVIHDKLTTYARKAIIAQQAEDGIAREQIMPDGRQFKKVATIRDLDLEVMFDKTKPNIIGTREFLNYRIWVQGELVMDVHPSNPIQYTARTVSLSPMGGFIQDDVAAISDSQCGELLSTALSGLQTDEGSADLLLPERVKNFLRSSYVEELEGDAGELEEGNARLVKGVFQVVVDIARVEDSRGMQP